jgi:hypothetical protein
MGEANIKWWQFPICLIFALPSFMTVVSMMAWIGNNNAKQD